MHTEKVKPEAPTSCPSHLGSAPVFFFVYKVIFLVAGSVKWLGRSQRLWSKGLTSKKEIFQGQEESRTWFRNVYIGCAPLFRREVGFPAFSAAPGLFLPRTTPPFLAVRSLENQ